MATDRFAELGGATGLGAPPAGVGVALPLAGSPELAQMGARSDAMEEFVQIKAILTQIERNLEELNAQHGQLSVAVFDAEKMRARIEELGAEISQGGLQVRLRLRAMDEELKATLAADPEAAYSAAYKMRRNMQVTATTKLMLTMGKFQDQQARFKAVQQQTAKRQLRLVKPDATEEEMQQVADGNGQQIFTQMLSSQAHQRQAAALQDVQEKHEEIIKLEKGINELHGLIVDLATLVETQGEQLDSIEYHIHSAKDYITLGVEELAVANEYAASSRKRVLQLGLLVSGVGLAVLFPVVVPMIGSGAAQSTGVLGLLGSGVGVAGYAGVQGSTGGFQSTPTAGGETKKIRVKCCVGDCVHEQKIEVTHETNLAGRSWSCVECAQRFELRQCANCFKLGTAPFVERQAGGSGSACESEGLLAAEAVACQRKGGTCGGAMSGAEVIVHASA